MSAPTLVTLVLDGAAPGGGPTLPPLTSGYASFAPNSVLLAPAYQGAGWIPPAAVQVQFRNAGGPPSAELLPTDDVNVSPAGWQWTVAFHGVPGNPAGFSFLLPLAGGATQYLSEIAQVSPVTPGQAFVPVPNSPPGSASKVLGLSSASPLVTEWVDESSGSGTVTSVSVASANGLAGSVATPATTPAITLSTTASGVLKGSSGALVPAVAGTDFLAPNSSGAALTGITAAQVGADASGAAAAVLASSAQKSANLSDLASASTARTNLELGSAATHASTDFDAAGSAAAAQAASLPSTDDLSAIATANATAGNVAMNSHKFTGLANGSAATDSAAFGQIPTALPPNGSAGGDLSGSYPSPTVAKIGGTAFSLPVSLASGGTGSGSRNFAGLLTPTAVKTSAYSAAAGDYVPCDTTSAGFTVTLPSAPADLTVIGVKHVIQGGTNTVTVATSGSDVYNKTGGGTSAALSLASQGILVQYRASGGIWYVVSDDLPLSQLDSRYVLVSALPLAIASGGTGQATQQAAINTLTGTQSSGKVLRSDGANATLDTIKSGDLPAATTGAQGAVVLDGTAGDIQPVGSAAAAGSAGKAADAGHVHAGLAKVAATAAAGYTLVNGTGTVISWTAPADGQLHRVMLFASLDVTSVATGGAVSITYTFPDANAHTSSVFAASQTAGGHLQAVPVSVQAGTTVTVTQSSALTAGAGVLWAELWGL